jgi:Putative Ig domain
VERDRHEVRDQPDPRQPTPSGCVRKAASTPHSANRRHIRARFWRLPLAITTARQTTPSSCQLRGRTICRASRNNVLNLECSFGVEAPSSWAIAVRCPSRSSTTAAGLSRLLHPPARPRANQPGGGVPPYTWSHVAGTLPPGLSVQASPGRVGGTPTTAGTFTFTFTVRVADSSGQSATQQFTIRVLP